VMKDGSIKPYPDERWNSWRNARKNELSPKDHWVCAERRCRQPRQPLGARSGGTGPGQGGVRRSTIDGEGYCSPKCRS
jgi:hypothetical protein